MKKTKAIVLLSILLVLIVVLGVFTFLSFKINEAYDYNSVVGAIKLNADLEGGAYVVLTAEVSDTEDGKYIVSASGEEIDDNGLKTYINDSIAILKKRLSDREDFQGATVVAQSTKEIRIEVPGVDNLDAVEILGGQGYVEFKKASGTNTDGSTKYVAITSADGENTLSGSHVSDAYRYQYQNGYYGVAVIFDEIGTKLFADVTREVASTGESIAIFFDDTKLIDMTAGEEISNGIVVIGASENGGNLSASQADEMVLKIVSGALPLAFNPNQAKIIGSVLGENTARTILIAGVIGFGIIILLLLIFSRGLGAISSISLFIYMLIDLFFVCVLPWVQISLAGVAGIFLGFGLVIFSNVIILGRIKDEYSLGKSLSVAVKNGFKNSLATVLDANIAVLIFTIVFWIAGAVGKVSMLADFAAVLFIGVLASLFTALLVTRFIAYLVTSITAKEGFYNLKRGEAKKS